MTEDIRYKGNGRKILIIGLDAITWDIINPMLKKGELPNIARLMEEGSYGNLESLNPMMSPVVWTSIATGKTPTKHGITDFYSKQNSMRALPIWEILSRFGRNVGIFGWLISSAPEVKDFIIPGWLATTTDTFPSHLSFIKEIEFLGKGIRRSGYISTTLKGLKNGLHFMTAFRACNHFFRQKVFKKSFLDCFYMNILIKNDMHTDFFLHLYKKYMPDFAAAILYATDQIPHHYWKFMDPAGFDVSNKEIELYKDVIRKTYIESDKSVGRFLSAVPDDAAVFLISDHGMGKGDHEIKHVFKTDMLLRYLDISKKELLHFQLLESNLHISIKGGIEDRERIEKEVLNKLKAIKIVNRNEPLFDVSFDEFGNILAVVKRSDLDLKNAVVKIQGNDVNFIDLVDTEHILSAKHTINGVFIAKGDGIKKGQKIISASILDIAPTILFMMGYPVAKDMDGDVLSEILEENYLEKNPMQQITSYEEYFDVAKQSSKDALLDEEAGIIKERLRELGYLE